MKVLFFGTPHIAVPLLEWLMKTQTVVGVVCQPDRPAGRGYELMPPPTKSFAQKNGLPVFQPHGSWDQAVLSTLKELNADVGVVVAYGRIMPASVFTIPRLGCVNIHFSQLPKYRGAAPMQWALINGEQQTGVTCFWLDEGMDTGPISHQKLCDISLTDDAVSIREKLVVLSIQVLIEFFDDLSNSRIIKVPQRGDLSKAPMLSKDMSIVDWSKNALTIHNQIRGMVEWPTARTRFLVAGVEKSLKIFKSYVVDAKIKPTEKHKPGSVISISIEQGLLVQTGEGSLSILEVQPEGRKRMSARDFWQGARLNEGAVFF